MLFPYQVLGADWLASHGQGLLADEMGLGKSAQAVRACELVQAKRVLIVCPAAARINWDREFKRFSKLPFSFRIILNGDDLGQITPQDSVILSYDFAIRFSEELKEIFDVLIIDEAHFLKSPDAKRTKAVLGKQGLCRRARYIWALSGTPAPNHAGELWPLLYTFGRTALEYDKFIERYCNSYLFDRERRQVTGTKTSMIPEIRQLLSPIILRRKKEDVMTELPPILFEDLVVEAGPVDLDTEGSFIQYVFPIDRRAELTQKLINEQTLLNTALQSAGGVRAREGMKVVEALANSISTLRRYTGLQKVKETAEIIKAELREGAYDKIVIFAVHQGVIDGLRRALYKFKPVTLYGRTPVEKRQRNIDSFQNNPKCRVFIGNIQAAGTAITLTAAHQVLFIEQDWVPGNNAQAAMRCHRIGQTKKVTVRFVGLANSIDEKVSQALKRKTRELTEIFDGPVLQTVKEGVTAGGNGG